MKYWLTALIVSIAFCYAANAQDLVGMSGTGIPRFVQSDEAYRATLQFTFWRDTCRTVALGLAALVSVIVWRQNARQPMKILRNGILFAIVLPTSLYLGAMQVLERIFG